MLIDYKATLIMWEKTMMPESKLDETSGKYVKTGNKVESTTYTFRDFDGSKLIFLSPKAEYRTFEGKEVIIQIELSHDDYSRKNKIQLRNVSLV